jgi:hypothetical protein
MRALFAGLFVFAAMMGGVWILETSHLLSGSWLNTLVIGVVMFGAIALAMQLFNKSGFRPQLIPGNQEAQIARLEQKGLLQRQSFRARRAFGVEEFEDEGPHYYIELDDGRVLYLNGQYLYEFEAIDDDPEFNQARLFPCSEFEILRHAKAGYVLDIRRAGTVLEPEIILPPYTEQQLQADLPEDGEIITSVGYDAIRQELHRAI